MSDCDQEKPEDGRPKTCMSMHRFRIHGDIGMLLPLETDPAMARLKLVLLLKRYDFDVWPDEELDGDEARAIEWQGSMEVPVTQFRLDK